MNEKVLVFEPDLMFSSRIESLAAKAGLDVKVTVVVAELQRALQEFVPKALLANLDALVDIDRSLAERVHGRCKLIGYYSHVDSKLAAQALACGFDIVLPRRRFLGKLKNIFENLSSI